MLDLESFYPCTYTAPARQAEIEVLLSAAASRPDGLLYEYEAYELFTLLGIDLPSFRYEPVGPNCEAHLREFMAEGVDYVLKAHIPGVIHKTDIGGVLLFVNRGNLSTKLNEFVTRLSASHALEGVIAVEMARYHNGGMSGGELLVSAYEDSAFGPCVAFGLGGTAVEFYKSVMRPSNSAAFIPCWVDLRQPSAAAMIEALPASQFLLGRVRGSRPQVNGLETITRPLTALQSLVRYYSTNNNLAEYVVSEVEINPAVVCKVTGRLLALDGVVRVRRNANSITNGVDYSRSIYTAHKPLYKCGKLFAPRSVIIAGASTKSLVNPCTVVLRKMLAQKEKTGFPEVIYCIHPSAKEIFGCPVYHTIAEVHEAHGGKPCDLFVCGVPATAAEEVICGSFDCHAAETIFVMTGGFAETEGGKETDRRIRAKLAEMDDPKQFNRRPLLNGPNTVGYNCSDKIDTVFLAAHKSSINDIDFRGRRNCALISQSGACMITRLSNLATRVSPLISCSVGNQMCMTSTDFLEWLITEYPEGNPEVEQMKRKIDVYGMYIEGLGDYDGVRLMHVVARARKMGKVVVIYKAGRTQEGKDATKGHTASMAGDYDMFASLLRASGAIVASSFDELEDCFYLATYVNDRMKSIREKRARGEKILISAHSNAGAEVAAYADNLFALPNTSEFMKLTSFDDETTARLTKIFAKYKIGGFMDIHPIIDSTAMIPNSSYDDIARTLLESKVVDVALFSFVGESHAFTTLGGEFGREHGEDCENDPDSVANRYIKIWEEYKDKPFAIAVDGGWKYKVLREWLNRHDVPTFEKNDRASRAMALILSVM